MKIAFIMPSCFNVLSVFSRPLGGSESAVTYLALELRKLGHEVSLFTTDKVREKLMGIEQYPFFFDGVKIEFGQEIYDHYDVFIIKNALPEIALTVKNIHPNAKAYFWTGHWTDQVAVQKLKDPNIINHLEQVICVSQWHKSEFKAYFNLPDEKISVMLNAISPFFENLYQDQFEFAASKPNHPAMVYTSTPFRGLDELLHLFPKCRLQNPTATLDVYSSMKVYGMFSEDQNFHNLYANAQQLENCRYHSSVSQYELATELRRLNILAYSNVYPETSCIAVMEALAAGLFIITTEHGALAETTMGFGELIPYQEPYDNEQYLNVLNKICQQILDNPSQFYRQQYNQVKLMNQSHTWRVRAREWQRFLQAPVSSLNPAIQSPVN